MDTEAFLVTMKLALVSTAILLALAMPIAFAFARARSRVASFVEAFLVLPMALPPTVLGFYFLAAFSPSAGIGSFLEKNFGIRLVFNFAGILVATLVSSFPYMLQSLKSGFRAVPREAVESAMGLGKAPLARFFLVYLPMMRNSVATGLILCITRAMGEFGLVLMVGGSIPGATRVLSIAIYEKAESLNLGGAWIESGLLLIAGYASCVALTWLQNARSRGRA